MISSQSIFIRYEQLMAATNERGHSLCRTLDASTDVS